MPEALCIVEHGYDHRSQAEDADVCRFGHWPRQRGLCGLLERQHAQDAFGHGPVGNRARMCGHGKARDLHDLISIVVNRERHAIVFRNVRSFLAVESAEKVQGEALVDIANGSRLRPTVRPHRRDRWLRG